MTRPQKVPKFNIPFQRINFLPTARGEGGRQWGMGVTGNGRFRFHQQLVMFARHIEMVDDIAHKIMIG
jgi:hypothetical protein